MQHAILDDEGGVAAASLSPSLERWWHRYSLCVVVVEDWGHSEKPGSGCKIEYEYWSIHAEENWRAEEALVIMIVMSLVIMIVTAEKLGD